jgi:hypothetical protein
MKAGKRILVALSLAVAALAASGQSVWRCGNSYSSKPCAGGAEVDVTDHKSAADAAQARKVVAEEERRAEAMEKARMAQEKNAPRVIVIGAREAPIAEHDKPVAAKGKPKKKKAGAREPDTFTASAPKQAKK